ncbi:FOG: EAL domain [Hahella chejuensis KCTC 2396]|uniref:FOG: EAL domain n=1 Tax=Hahella chejuensis (strain KCTC 2396) TaxID=349521 RepID=Q2SQ87_HAHCH|nr:GGDEF domain-containing phosphodiesterase [Hahella chejuensis]ABC27187.1 FOG: EAL domain [Hahella chejuensis KCTC 2396]
MSDAFNTTTPQRSEFLQELRRAATVLPEGRVLGVIVFDLRRLLRTNEIYGDAVGDHLFQAVGERLHKLREGKGPVYCVGDGRFAITVQAVSAAILQLAAQQMLKVLEQPLDIDSHRLSVHLTCGGASYPAHASKPETLLTCAEQALSGAKYLRVRYMDYSDMPESHRLGDWNIEREVIQAIEQNSLELYFQPKIHIPSQSVAGAEALLRWRSPTRGYVSPELFIPYIENAGLSYELQKWVLNTALRLGRDWLDRYPDFALAVNISPEFVSNPELSNLVLGALGIWDTEPENLVLELTETVLLWERNRSIDNLEALRVTGVSVAIDDFGTGYSSLEYFKDLPANQLKIDKAFVFRMLDHPADGDMVGLMIRLAHIFGMQVVAEGVEDAASLHRLAAMGCEQAQGYYFCKPIPRDAFTEWMQAFHPAQYFREDA